MQRSKPHIPTAVATIVAVLVAASAAAMNRVPTNTASTGIGARPWGSDQAPLSSSATRAGPSTPPPTASSTSGAARSLA